MDFLVPDGAQGDHDHVEAVKPAPVLDVVEPGRTHGGEQQQCQSDDFQQAEPLQFQKPTPTLTNSRSARPFDALPDTAELLGEPSLPCPPSSLA